MKPVEEFIYRMTFNAKTMTVDVEQVGELIRCKDCKYRPNTIVGWIECPMTGKGTRQDNDYCSYGKAERKD